MNHNNKDHPLKQMVLILLPTHYHNNRTDEVTCHQKDQPKQDPKRGSYERNAVGKIASK